MSKIIKIKSFDSSGNFIKTINDATFDKFRKTINGGLGDLSLILARKIDAFNTNNDVSLGNKIEVWVYDEDTGVSGIKIYSGFIEQQNIISNGTEEYVEIVCYGIISKLNNDILKDGDQTTLYTIVDDGLTISDVSLSAAEVSDVVRAIVNKFNSANPNNYIYTGEDETDTIIDTGNMMAYKFEVVNYFNALEICRGIAPQNWFWFLGSDNFLHFKTKAESADHTFLLSKDISNIRASKSADAIKNILLLFDGDAVYKQYKDDDSIATYGRRVKQLTDNDIKTAETDETTMNNIGESFINENKDPKIRLEIDIIDNNESSKGYDIESIDPGDTCRITGITPDGSIFSDNMVIKEVTWTIGKATLIIETENTFDMNRFILNINKQVEELTKNSGTNIIPESYT